MRIDNRMTATDKKNTSNNSPIYSYPHKTLARMRECESSFQSALSLKNSYGTELMAQVITSSIPPMINGNQNTKTTSPIYDSLLF